MSQLSQPVSGKSWTRAVRGAVPADEPLLAGEPFDYADTFVIRRHESDQRSAEEVVRCALERASSRVSRTIRFAHRYILLLKLGPGSSPHHIFGWKIVTAQHDVIQLEARSPLLGRAVLVARTDGDDNALTTYLFYTRPLPARAVWSVIGPLHRRIAPRLLEGSQ